MPRSSRSSSSKNNSTANLGFEAKLWLAADEVRNQNDEGRIRLERPDQGVRAADYPPLRKPAKNHGSANSWQTTPPVGNIGRRELPRSPSRTKQTRMERLGMSDIDGKAARVAVSEWATSESVHREMRRFTARTGRVGILAGTAGGKWPHDPRATPAIARRVRRTHRDFRYHYQTRPRFGLSRFLPSSFLLQTFPAWVQHFIHHLAPRGMAGLVLANGSMSSDRSGEGDIRRALIEADLVDCMVALPGQLFYSTQIPVCLWAAL